MRDEARAMNSYKVFGAFVCCMAAAIGCKNHDWLVSAVFLAGMVEAAWNAFPAVEP